MATVPISVLLDHTQPRLEEDIGAGEFWSRAYELTSAAVEAMNDLMLLVGRPTQTVNLPFTLTPNSCFQAVPEGLFIITDILGANGPLYRINLFDLDYTQSSWGSDWQQDVDVTCARFCPIGFNMFAVHPAVSTAQTVQLTGIAYPAQEAWPWPETLTIPFQNEFFVALETYMAAYCRIKESGLEFEGGLSLFQQYMALAARMTEVQDLRDPLLFSSGFGAQQNVNPASMR